MIRLMLADDHNLVRTGLKQIFTLVTDIAVTAEAANGAQVLEQLRNGLALDLLILDLNMTGISSVDLIQRIKGLHATLPILILSMHNEPQVAMRMLKAGANGYVTKDCDPQVLLTAIRKIAGGGRYIEPEIAEKMVFDQVPKNTRPLHEVLSDREFQIFGLLAAGKSVNDIAEHLAISNKTVSTHKSRLMEKLHLASMADLVRYSLEHLQQR